MYGTSENVTTELTILTPKDIMRIYGLPRITVYEILNIRGCPTIKGGCDIRGRSTGKRYLIEKTAFEEFLKSKNKLFLHT